MKKSNGNGHAFRGTIGKTASESKAEKPTIQYPPQGAPNVVLVMLDDVGFGAASTFGGPIPMPALEALASRGLRYNQFHTTALCSPSRAALITGRNHHSCHMGAIAEIATGFPGYDGAIPKTTATVAEVLRQAGYNTAWFGKGHVTPMWEVSPAGPFDRWPTGLGFERFYGFLGGETSQWEPALYEQTTPIAPYVGREGYHLTEDLADQAIAWIRMQKTSAPQKPFFAYFAPGAGHNPHHVAKDMAGWSLYVREDGRPEYFYNWMGHEKYAITGDAPLPAGRVSLRVAFAYDGGGLGKGGDVTLSVDGNVAARGRVERTVPFLFSMSGETFDVGQDTGAPAGPYEHALPFTGEIENIDIELEEVLDARVKREIFGGQVDAALRSH